MENPLLLKVHRMKYNFKLNNKRYDYLNGALYAFVLVFTSGCAYAGIQNKLQKEISKLSNNNVESSANNNLISPVLRNTKETKIDSKNKQITYEISGLVTDINLKKVSLEQASGNTLKEKPLWVASYYDADLAATVVSFNFMSLPKGDEISFRFEQEAFTYAGGKKSLAYLDQKNIDTKAPTPQVGKKLILLDKHNLEIEMSEKQIEIVNKEQIKIINKDGVSQGDFTIRSDDKGTLSFETAQPLEELYYGIIFGVNSIRDATGNILKQNILVIERPDKPQVDTPHALTAPVIIDVHNTNSSKPTIIIEGLKDSVIQIFQADGTMIGEGQLWKQKKGVFTLSESLSDGTHTIKAQAIKDGITSEHSKEVSLIIDTEAPETPTLFLEDRNTEHPFDSTPIITAEAEVASQVKLFDSAEKWIGSGKTDEHGQVEIKLFHPLSSGTYSITAVSIDNAKNQSEKSEAVTFTIEASPTSFIEDFTEFITGVKFGDDGFGVI